MRNSVKMHGNDMLPVKSCISFRDLLALIVLSILILTQLQCVAQTTSTQEVVMQIVLPYQSMAEKKYQIAHVDTKGTIKHGREVIYNNLREHFAIDSWLNFTKSESPNEILSLFCNQIFKKHVNTILTLNHGSGTEASNNYILQLADHLGYPVISWDPHFPGALQVCNHIY